MAFYPIGRRPGDPSAFSGDPGYPSAQAYVKDVIAQHPELVPDSVAAAERGVPSGPVGGKRSRAALALQGLRGSR